MPKIIVNGMHMGYVAPSRAQDVSYDNTTSGLSATDVKNALDELKSDIPTKVSELENDAGYLTTHQDISGKVNKTGDTMSGNLWLNNASTTTSNVDSVLTIGNQIPEGTVGNSAGTIHLYARNGNRAMIYPDGNYPNDNTAIRLPHISGRLVVDNDIAGGLPSPLAGYSEAGEAYYDVELNEFSLYILIVSVNGGGGSRFLTPDIYLIYVEDRNSHIVGAAQLAKRLTDAAPTITYQSDTGKYRITKDNSSRRSSLFRLTQFS